LDPEPDNLLVTAQRFDSLERTVLFGVGYPASRPAERPQPRHIGGFLRIRALHQRHYLIDAGHVAQLLLRHMRGNIGTVCSIEREPVERPKLYPIAVDRLADITAAPVAFDGALLILSSAWRTHGCIAAR